MNKQSLKLWLGWTYLALFFFWISKGVYSFVIEPVLASKRFLVFLGIAGISVLALIFCALIILFKREAFFEFVKRFDKRFDGLKSWLAWTLSVILLIAPFFLQFAVARIEPKLNNILFQSIYFSVPVVSLLATYLLTKANKSFKFSTVLLLTIMLSGTFYHIAFHYLPVVSIPLSLGWSEGNRLYDYSVFFGADRYDIVDDGVFQTFISAGRALYFGLIYLIPNIGIQGVRFWQALMNTFPMFLIGFFLIRVDFSEQIGKFQKWLFVIWAYLFLMQGPIHSYFMMALVVTFIGSKQKKLIWAIILVALGGFIANISRWTWTFAPGLFAGMIALLQIEDPKFKDEGWKELIRPIVLGLSGLIGGLGLSNVIPVKDVNIANFEGGGGLSLSSITHAFDQSLLWYRLLPNKTFKPGILLALLIAIIFVYVLLVVLYIQKKWRPNWLQLLGVIGVQGALLGVGVVASTKIGGGGDLHNLDMFLLGTLILAASAWKPLCSFAEETKLWQKALLVLMLIIPIFSPFHRRSISVFPSQETTQYVLEKVQGYVDVAKEEGEILFIDERQLLTFGYIDDVPLVMEYEKKYLNDMAMAENEAYFEQFHADLEAGRFALIVSESLSDVLYKPNTSFGEENTPWVKWVSIPILDTYEEVYKNKDYQVQLFVPKK